MGKGLIGLGHAMGVIAPLDRAAAIGGRIKKLAGKFLRHRLFVAGLGKADQPPDGQGLLTVPAHLDRHLIGGAADSAGLHFDLRFGVFDCPLEDLDRIVARALFDEAECAVENPLRNSLLPRFVTLLMNLVTRREL